MYNKTEKSNKVRSCCEKRDQFQDELDGGEGKGEITKIRVNFNKNLRLGANMAYYTVCII